MDKDISMMQTITDQLLRNASGFRCGVTLPYQNVKLTFADIPGYFNVATPKDSSKNWETASGSISKNQNHAISAAVGESMERYCAAVIPITIKKHDEINNEKILPISQFSLFSKEQYGDPAFEWKEIDESNVLYGHMFDIFSNEKVWVPQDLIGLGPKEGRPVVPSTSTGLAAHPKKQIALLLAIQEILERDALTVTWLNSLGGREIEIGSRYTKIVKQKNAQAFCFDFTQSWNPFPVVAVCGYIPLRGRKRISMGVACRETYEEAIDKAFAEWIQGAIFAGHFVESQPNLKYSSSKDLRDFNDHAAYYTLYPEEWENVPLIKHRKKIDIKNKTNSPKNTYEKIKHLIEHLNSNGINILYREITLPDVKEAGLTVVRVVSPQLSMIHGDERAPFLGGRIHDIKWRYPNTKSHGFPNKYPHPLG